MWCNDSFLSSYLLLLCSTTKYWSTAKCQTTKPRRSQREAKQNFQHFHVACKITQVTISWWRDWDTGGYKLRKCRVIQPIKKNIDEESLIKLRWRFLSSLFRYSLVSRQHRWCFSFNEIVLSLSGGLCCLMVWIKREVGGEGIYEAKGDSEMSRIDNWIKLRIINFEYL